MSKEAIESTAVAVGRIKLEEGDHDDFAKQPQPSTSGSVGMPDASSKALFNKLITRAKQEQERGNLQKALQKYKEARKLYPSEKVDKKIVKIEAFLGLSEEEEEEEEEEDDGTVTVIPGFTLPRDIYDKLYPYQQEGVRWFYRLFAKRKGGILGDDMGLGKTIQVSAFLCGMFLQDKIHSVLIILPVALITNWERELEKWASDSIRVKQFHGSSERERTRNLERVQRRGGVVLTTYGMVVNNWEQLSSSDYKEFVWDYLILDEGHKIKNPTSTKTSGLSSVLDLVALVHFTTKCCHAIPAKNRIILTGTPIQNNLKDYVILDEGHKIKNPTKTTKCCHAIPAKNRIILTGTPIQNNLKEMWALFDFVSQGTLLGTAKTFKMEYENPITRARERDATAGEIHLGNQMSDSLRKIIAPYFLRRTKAEVLPKDKENADPNADNQGAQATELATGSGFPSLERKNDLILWVVLSPTQQQIYRDFLSLDRVKELLMTTRSPLAELNVLKKICDHPRLLSTLACAQLGLDGEDGMDPEDVDNIAHEVAANSIENISTEQLMAESGKTSVLVELLMRLREEGHQTLVFSQSRKMLDIIQKILKSRGFKIIRIDGTITKLEDRDKRIRRFQNDPSWSVFLLTTQVGGVGLNLTAADRVIIYDPSWNPATDAQAVDRAYRIGQKKSVVIYRFITCGTVEEKIYRRQVFKESVTRQTTGACKDPFRYFSRQDLRELFVMDNPEHSTTQQQLAEMHSHSRNSDTTLDEHIAYLHTLGIFGISDHDLLYTKQADQEELQEGQEYIQQRVHKARELVMAESQLHHQMNEMRQNTTEAGFLRRHGGKQAGQGVGTQESFPDNLPELFKPSQDDNPRAMLNKPKAKKEKAHVSSDDYTDSPVHPKTSPPDLPGHFIDLCQETEEEQAQQLEKSFAKISISSQEKEEEEEEMNSAMQADQDDAEDTDLQLALAMSLSQSVVQGNSRDGHNTQVGEMNSSTAHDSTNKRNVEDDSIPLSDDDRATPGLNRALCTGDNSIHFVVDSDEEDPAREQQNSRCSSGRPVSRGDVFVIEDSEPEDSGSDNDLPVVSIPDTSRKAVIQESEEEKDEITEQHAIQETSVVGDGGMADAVAMETQHLNEEEKDVTDQHTIKETSVVTEMQHLTDDSKEESLEADNTSQLAEADNRRTSVGTTMEAHLTGDVSEANLEASDASQNSRVSDQVSFSSATQGNSRKSLDDSLIKSARRRPRPRVIDSDSEDDKEMNRVTSSSHQQSSSPAVSGSGHSEESSEEEDSSSAAGSPVQSKGQHRPRIPLDSDQEEDGEGEDLEEEKLEDMEELEEDEEQEEDEDVSDNESSDHSPEEDEAESSEIDEYYSPEETSMEEEKDGATGAMAPPLSEQDQTHEHYASLVQEGRNLEAQGRLKAALTHYLEALDIDGNDPNLQMRTLMLAKKVHNTKGHDNE